MSKTKVLALSILGIVVPVVLALSAYLIARSTIGVAGTVPSLTHAPAPGITSSESPFPTPSATRTGMQSSKPRPTSAPATAPAPAVTATATDDHGGRCSEPEHLNDPECEGDDSSGKGSDDSGPGGGGGDD